MADPGGLAVGTGAESGVARAAAPPKEASEDEEKVRWLTGRARN